MPKKKQLVQVDQKIGYSTGSGANTKFQELANFAIYLEKYITAPDEIPTCKGFIVKVVQRILGQTLEG